MKWTIVQHSGFGYAGNPQFEAAVETRSLKGKQEANRVEKAGGVVLEDYGVAEDFAEAANYPPELDGIVPGALGTFSDKEIDGLKIYIPLRKVIG